VKGKKDFSCSIGRNFYENTSEDDPDSEPGDNFTLIVSLPVPAQRHHSEERSLLADQLIGREFTDAVQSGDPLTAIGARVGVDTEILAATNHPATSARLKPAQ
jgi:hypothetical protein